MPKMILMRGGPGSGKSTMARALVRKMIGGRIFSSDDTFINLDTGLYEFNPDLLAKAHGACLKQAADTMAYGRGSFVVDNTNASHMEMAPYLALCNAYGYECEVVRVMCDPGVAWERQTHGVLRAKFDEIHNKVVVNNVPSFWRKALWVTIRDVWTDGSDRATIGFKVYHPYSGARCGKCAAVIVYATEGGETYRYCDSEYDTCECFDGREEPGETFVGRRPPRQECNCGVSMGLRGDHEGQCRAAYLQRS